MSARAVDLDQCVAEPDAIKAMREWFDAAKAEYGRIVAENRELRKENDSLRYELAKAHRKIRQLTEPDPLPCSYCQGDGRGCIECDGTGGVKCGVCGEYGAVKTTEDAGAVCAACLALVEEVG